MKPDALEAITAIRPERRPITKERNSGATWKPGNRLRPTDLESLRVLPGEGVALTRILALRANNT